MDPQLADSSTVSAADWSGAVGPMPFVGGQLISGRFRIIRQIGEGGMGIVYEVRDEKLNERRALKCAKLGYASRLSPEARHALRITHPNVCRLFEIHSIGTWQGAVDFITMEYLDGGTLARRLASGDRLPLGEARDLALQICEGLHAAHSRGVLHRDLKSSNIMLAVDGTDRPRAVVTDFGLAQASTARPLRGSATASGTRAYLAPERAAGAPATVASDIYALGIVLHELVAGGRHPSGAAGTLALAPGIPRPWRDVIAQCLDPEPARRFASAAAVARALTDTRARRHAMAWAAVTVLGLAALSWQVVFPTPLAARLAILPIEAVGADEETRTLVEGLSSDLSARLTRRRPRPAALVIIPVQETRRVPSPDLETLRQGLGASHVLRASAARRGNRFTVRSAIAETSTKVDVRAAIGDYDLADAGAAVAALTVMVANVFRLPASTATETIAPRAYRAYAEGQSAMQAGASAYQRAIGAFEQAAALDPSSVLPWTGLAEACYAAWEATADGRWLRRGRSELNRAEALNADSLSVRLAAGRLNLVPGSYDAAVQEYQRAIQLDATSPEAWRGLARAYQDWGDHDSEAAAAYARSIEVEPGYYAPLVNLGDFYRTRGNYAEAEKYFRQVVVLVPRLLAARSNLGGLYSDMGRYAEAREELARALEIDPASRAVLNNLATVHQYEGQDAEAIALLERARRISPDTPTLLLNLGDSNRRLGRNEEAATAYRRARELADAVLLLNPRDDTSRAFVAYFNLRLGDVGAARRELTQALNASRDNRAVIRRAAIIYDALGERDRALAVLEGAPADVVRELNRHPDTRELRADARFAQLLARITP
jgi:serine/threonine protein kinase/tetratricopeptide (TPR) repeat protein